MTLDSLLFFSAQKWAVWLNGKKWTPETNSPRLKIRSVAQDRVRLAYKTGENETEKEAILFPHQTLNLMTGEVKN